MRIAYISLHWPRTVTSGVGKKILGQISAWRAAGHQVEFFMHSVRYEPASELVPGRFFFYEQKGKLQTEFNRIGAARAMLADVRAYQPDLIYLRYGMYVYPIQKLAAIAPVVEEINTNDLTQHDELGWFYSFYNRITRGILLKSVRGLVAMTQELADAPAFAAYHKATCVISNGIDLENIQPVAAPNNDIPRLLFIATPGYTWHGVDKLITLAVNFPDVIIDVVGYDQIDGLKQLPPNLVLHGYLEKPQYQKVVMNTDVAIGSLALHRIAIEEACPLKTRECLAYGVPMILPYIDNDLENAGQDFLLRIPNKENNMQTHGKAIRDFAYRMRGRRAAHKDIMQLDNRQKEKQRLQFFEEILKHAA